MLLRAEACVELTVNNSPRKHLQGLLLEEVHLQRFIYLLLGRHSSFTLQHLATRAQFRELYVWRRQCMCERFETRQRAIQRLEEKTYIQVLIEFSKSQYVETYWLLENFFSQRSTKAILTLLWYFARFPTSILGPELISIIKGSFYHEASLIMAHFQLRHFSHSTKTLYNTADATSKQGRFIMVHKKFGVWPGTKRCEL